jgi:general secretion pathway protein M
VNAIRSYFSQLEKRDQIAVAALALFLGALLLYFAVWTPVRSYQQDSLARRDSQLSLLHYMRASEKQARSSTTGKKVQASGQSLITDVSSSAQQAGIKPNRLQPEGNDAVSVWFDNVPFDQLVSWIEQLSDQRGISVRQIAIDRQDVPGTVNARIVLES